MTVRPGFHGYRRRRRPCRHPQSRAGGAHGHLLVARRRADRRFGGAGGGCTAAPGRLRAARARHAGDARHARGLLRASQCRRGAGDRTGVRAGRGADARRCRAPARQAGGDPRHPVRRRDRARDGEGQPDRAVDGRCARDRGARMVRRVGADPVAEMRRIRLHVRSGVESNARQGHRPSRRDGRFRGARRDRGNHGGGAPARVARDQRHRRDPVDPDHHPR